MIAMLSRLTTMANRAAVAALLLTATFGAGAQTIRYIHTDALGSPVVVTDQARNVVERREYEPYGATLGAVKDGPGYTGHVSDAQTGLSYMQQRYYDPQVGRFLSVDPVAAYGGDMRHFNLYAYAYNNPYKFTDPDGRCPPKSSSSTCLDAKFDESRSSGENIQLSSQTERTALANSDAVKVGNGSREKAVTIEGGPDGEESIRIDPGMSTSSDSSGFYAEITPTENTVAVMHGHKEESQLVDKQSPGDSGPLVSPGVPNITVSSDGARVGVKEVVDGRVQFRMLKGRMNSTEQRLIQKNLNKQQELFYRPEQ